MNRKHLIIGAVMALAALAAVSSVEAQPFGAHPALVRVSAAQPIGIDPNTFIVAHPAGLALVHGHANHDHPAVTASRDAQARPLDANSFIVQPPASVRWMLASEPPAQLAALR